MTWKHFPLVMVSGQRNLHSAGFIMEMLRRLWPAPYKPTLRQGGAEGVDTDARIGAETLGWQVEPSWKPRYKDYDNKKVAPLKRTEDMLDGMNGPNTGMWSPVPPDVLVVFRRGPELPHGGTGHAVREARRRRIPIIVFEFPEEE